MLVVGALSVTWRVLGETDPPVTAWQGVTLDGTLIAKNGNITGGAPLSDASSRFNEKHIARTSAFLDHVLLLLGRQLTLCVYVRMSMCVCQQS